MPHPLHNEVQIPIPFSALVGSLDQLPTEALLQLLHATEAALATRANARPEAQVIQGEDAQFWESELGQYIAAAASQLIPTQPARPWPPGDAPCQSPW